MRRVQGGGEPVQPSVVCLEDLGEGEGEIEGEGVGGHEDECEGNGLSERRWG